MSDAVANLLVKILYESESPSAAIESMKELKRQAESVTRAVRATNQAQSSPAGVQRIKERIAALKEEADHHRKFSWGRSDLDDRIHKKRLDQIKTLERVEKAAVAGQVRNLGVLLRALQTRFSKEIEGIKRVHGEQIKLNSETQKFDARRLKAEEALRQAEQKRVSTASSNIRQRISLLNQEAATILKNSRGELTVENRIAAVKKRALKELGALHKQVQAGKIKDYETEIKKINKNADDQIKRIKDVARAEKEAYEEKRRRQERLVNLEKQHHQALKMNSLFDRRAGVMHSQALRMNAAFDRRRDNDIQSFGRMQAQALRMDDQRTRRMRREAERDASRWESTFIGGPMASRGMGAAMFMGGFSRLGGFMPSSPIGFMARQSVTGSLIGLGGGQMIGSLLPGLGSTLGRGIGSMLGGLNGLRYGGPIGAAIGLAGSMGSTLYGGFRGMTMGLTTGAMTEGSKLIFRAASTFASSVASFARTTYEWTKRLGIAGLGAATALTAAGVSRAGAREQAIAGLGVVAGRNAPGLMNFVSSRRSSMFSRTEMINAATQGAIFGLSPDLIRTFLPMMQNAAALTGNPVDQGLRALSRAAFQAEPEAAEAYGLNLYEKNLRQSFPNANFLDPNEKARVTFMVAAQQLSRFRGAEQMISGTIPGATRSMRTGLDDFLSTLGASFAQTSNFMGRATSFREYLQGPRGQGLAQRVGGLFGGVFNAGANFLQNTALPGIRQFFSADREGTAMDVLGSGARGLLRGAEGLAGRAGRFLRQSGPAIPGALKRAYETGEYDEIQGLLPGMAGEITKGVLQFIRSIKAEIETLFSSGKPGSIAEWFKSQWAEFKIHLENEDFSGMAKSVMGALFDAWKNIEGEIAASLAKIIKESIRSIDYQAIARDISESALGVSNPNISEGERFVRWLPMGVVQGAKKVLSGAAAGLGAMSNIDPAAWGGGAPTMHSGGRVPGPYGKEVPAILQAGEIVISKEQAQRLPKFHQGTVGPLRDSTDLVEMLRRRMAYKQRAADLGRMRSNFVGPMIPEDVLHQQAMDVHVKRSRLGAMDLQETERMRRYDMIFARSLRSQFGSPARQAVNPYTGQAVSYKAPASGIGLWSGSITDAAFNFAAESLGDGSDAFSRRNLAPATLPDVQRIDPMQQYIQHLDSKYGSGALGRMQMVQQALQGGGGRNMNFHGNVMINGDGNKLARMADGI